MKQQEILARMSLSDQIALCSGADFWHTKAMPAYGIPAIMVADGPHGLRKQVVASDMLGINNSLPATCFPSAVSTGCSWDRELLLRIGQAIGREAAAHEVGIVLGPGANIKRNPLCGRNFEYFSEDPYLTGILAGAFIKGLEAGGAASSLKHFAFNNQEYKRFSSDSIMDERTMREIYLTGFELAVREGKPSTVMSSYNMINGQHCSESNLLLSEILRREWGFDGLVVTDWGGMSDRLQSFRAGCDLCMPGGSAFMEKEAAAAVLDGSLAQEDVARSAGRVLDLVFKTTQAEITAEAPDMEAHHALARQAAEESAVLMKNQDSLLPLATDEAVVFIGPMAREIRYQGAGSSHINPWRLTSVTAACPDVPFAAGCDDEGRTTEELLADAVQAAKKARVAVVFAGLTPAFESEGFDRDNLRMPEGHVRLIEAVAAANPNTAVVLMCGSVVELPWENQVKAILYMGLPGQAGGEAIARLLFGQAVPCGKLAESWPIRYEDCVCSSYYGGTRKDGHYREGIYVGYRYYATSGTAVRYPFGHGLSYVSFAYSDLTCRENSVTVTVTNNGMVTAKEVVQVYVLPPASGPYRPLKELKAFAKIELRPGEAKTVTLQLDDRSFAIWQDGWVIPGGTYTIAAGCSSEDQPVSCTIEMPGDVMAPAAGVPAWYLHPFGPPAHQDWEQLLGRKIETRPLRKGEFTMDNTVMEMKPYSLAMRLLYKVVSLTLARGYNGKDGTASPEYRMTLYSALDASLYGMRVSGGMKNLVLEGLLAMANGHFWQGIRLMLTRV